VQGVEHFDRLPANFSPDQHIAWRSTKISRRIAEIGLKEQGIKREVQEYDGECDHRAVALVQAPENPAVLQDVGERRRLVQRYCPQI